MNLHPPFDRGDASIMRAAGRLRRTTSRRSTGRSSWSATTQLRAEQRRGGTRGDVRQLGIGLSTYIEMCGLAPSHILGALRYAAGGWDAATIRVPADRQGGPRDRHVAARPGARDDWSQIVADGLGVHSDDIEVLHGDTAVAPLGMDTYGSRSVAVGGVAVHLAMEKIMEKARKIAAHELEVAEEDLEYDGRHVQREGRAGQGAHDPRAGVLGVARARPAERRGAEPGGARRCATRRTSRGRSAPTSAWSRSTRRPGPSTS